MSAPRFGIENLPERLRAQVLTDYLPKSRCAPQMRTSRGTPNRCEAEYNHMVLRGMGRFEAVILRCPGGNYTPDWMTVDDGVVTFHEVKGAYRFGSESRATLAFMSAAAAFPFWRFVWAQRAKDGTWNVRRVVNGGQDGDGCGRP